MNCWKATSFAHSFVPQPPSLQTFTDRDEPKERTERKRFHFQVERAAARDFCYENSSFVVVGIFVWMSFRQVQGGTVHSRPGVNPICVGHNYSTSLMWAESSITADLLPLKM